MNREDFAKSLHPLKQYLKLHDKALEEVIQKSYLSNSWFIPEFNTHAIHAIADQYLDKDKWMKWRESYPVGEVSPKRIAIIMAGNVPLVGCHDLLCVLTSGHTAVIKLSEKDSLLTRFVN